SPAAASDADPWGGVDNAAAAIDRRDFAAHPGPDAEPEARRGPVDLSAANISWSVGHITEGAGATDAGIWGAPPAAGAEAAIGDWGWTPPPAAVAPIPEAPPALAPSADEQPDEAAAPAPATVMRAPETDA